MKVWSYVIQVHGRAKRDLGLNVFPSIHYFFGQGGGGGGVKQFPKEKFLHSKTNTHFSHNIYYRALSTENILSSYLWKASAEAEFN